MLTLRRFPNKGYLGRPGRHKQLVSRREPCHLALDHSPDWPLDGAVEPLHPTVVADLAVVAPLEALQLNLAVAELRRQGSPLSDLDRDTSYGPTAAGRCRRRHSDSKCSTVRSPFRPQNKQPISSPPVVGLDRLTLSVPLAGHCPGSRPTCPVRDPLPTPWQPATRAVIFAKD